MTTIAIIGGDGAGKSSICRMLEERHDAPIVTVYMGMNPDSSRVALPTTRLVHALKVRRARGGGPKTRSGPRQPTSLHGLEHRTKSRGPVWSTLRLANRIAEETMRVLVTKRYERGGSLVLHDRHFRYDYAPAGTGARDWTTRVHQWFLRRVLPHPDVLILLDAEPEVLHARTGEVSVAYLADRRVAYLKEANDHPNFHVVDVDRPIEDVYRDVAGIVTEVTSTRPDGHQIVPGGNT